MNKNRLKKLENAFIPVDDDRIDFYINTGESTDYIVSLFPSEKTSRVLPELITNPEILKWAQ